jgi:hypothetical protein
MWGYKAFIAFDCTVRKGYKPFPTCLVLLLGRVRNSSLLVYKLPSKSGMVTNHSLPVL